MELPTTASLLSWFGFVYVAIDMKLSTMLRVRTFEICSASLQISVFPLVPQISKVVSIVVHEIDCTTEYDERPPDQSRIHVEPPLRARVLLSNGG